MSREKAMTRTSTGAVTPKQWANTQGRHAMDAYLEDMLALRIQGDVDPVDDRSVRMVDENDSNEIVLVGSVENAARLKAKLRKGAKVSIQPVQRPSEEMLQQMMMERPPPNVVLPPAAPPTPALPPSSLEPVTVYESSQPIQGGELVRHDVGERLCEGLDGARYVPAKDVKPPRKRR